MTLTGFEKKQSMTDSCKDKNSASESEVCNLTRE